MKKVLYSFLILSAIGLLAFTARQLGGEVKFIDLRNIDNNVKPGENFYLYANGGWLKRFPVPPTESRWGAFSEVQEFNYTALKQLLDTAAANTAAAKGSPDQKVGDFYLSGMDSANIEAAGFSPIKSDLERINKIKNIKSLINEIGYQHSQGAQPLFYFFAEQDAKNSTRIVPQFYQGGLGLPDRDYYFKTDERSRNIRTAYLNHIAAMFKLLGDDEQTALSNAGDVMNLESALASASMTRVEMRDPEKVYNVMSIKQLQQYAPIITWKEFMAQMLVKGRDTVIVGQPDFLAEINKQLGSASISTWKNYLRWNVVRGASPYLSSAFVNENFNFYSKTLSGQKEMKPRWKRVLATIDGNLGEVLGQMYVNKYFKPEAKKRMLEMVGNLAKTYEARIKRLDWMTPKTKEMALNKLHTFMLKIGYPDKWKDYSSVSIDKSNYLKNIRACQAFEYRFNINKLGKPVDRTEWGMTPPTVNAYYNPSMNEIVFPAGILQLPFFDNAADDAINYGAIGGVIGHEMTHGFDDQGSQFDADGNLKNWWSDVDKERFKQRTDMLVAQYNSFTVLDTVHVNGELTLGENIADLGGIAIAYEAFKNTPQGKGLDMIDGFTPDQRFFISWAQVWRQNIRDAETARRIIVDPHSPGMYRCNGPLSNMPEFYSAFGVREGDKMWRAENDRVKVW